MSVDDQIIDEVVRRLTVAGSTVVRTESVAQDAGRRMKAMFNTDVTWRQLVDGTWLVEIKGD